MLTRVCSVPLRRLLVAAPHTHSHLLLLLRHGLSTAISPDLPIIEPSPLAYPFSAENTASSHPHNALRPHDLVFPHRPNDPVFSNATTVVKFRKQLKLLLEMDEYRPALVTHCIHHLGTTLVASNDEKRQLLSEVKHRLQLKGWILNEIHRKALWSVMVHLVQTSGELHQVIDDWPLLSESEKQCYPFNAIFTKASILNDEHAGLRALAIVDQLELPQSITTYNRILRLFSKSENLERCQQVLTLMKKHHVPCNSVSYSIMFHLYRNLNDVSSAVAFFRQIDAQVVLDLETVQPFFRLLLEQNQLNLALELVSERPAGENLELTNALLAPLASRVSFVSVEEASEVVSTIYRTAPVLALSTLLEMFANQPLADVHLMFAAMTNIHVFGQPSPIRTITLSSPRLSDIINHMAKLVRANKPIVPTLDVWILLLKLTKEKRSELKLADVLRIQKLATATTPLLSVNFYCGLLENLMLFEKWDQMIRIYKTLVAEGRSLTGLIHGLHLCAEMFDQGGLPALRERLESAGTDVNFRLSPILLAPIIRYYSHIKEDSAGLVECLEVVYQALSKYPRMYTSEAELEGSSTRQLWAVVFSSQNAALSCFLGCLSKLTASPRDFFLCLQLAEQYQILISPSVYLKHFQNMWKADSSKGLLDLIRNQLDRIIVQNIHPGPFSFLDCNIALNFYKDFGTLQDIENVVDWMLRYRIVPTSGTMGLLARCYYARQELDMCLNLITSCWIDEFSLVSLAFQLAATRRKQQLVDLMGLCASEERFSKWVNGAGLDQLSSPKLRLLAGTVEKSYEASLLSQYREHLWANKPLQYRTLSAMLTVKPHKQQQILDYVAQSPSVQLIEDWMIQIDVNFLGEAQRDTSLKILEWASLKNKGEMHNAPFRMYLRLLHANVGMLALSRSLSRLLSIGVQLQPAHVHFCLQQLVDVHPPNTQVLSVLVECVQTLDAYPQLLDEKTELLILNLWVEYRQFSNIVQRATFLLVNKDACGINTDYARLLMTLPKFSDLPELKVLAARVQKLFLPEYA